MRAIALVDLDDTLFQTLRKCPPDVPAERLVPLGFARDGSPLSYATPRQLNLLEWLAESAWLVPVTARSREALMRARIKASRLRAVTGTSQAVSASHSISATWRGVA